MEIEHPIVWLAGISETTRKITQLAFLAAKDNEIYKGRHVDQKTVDTLTHYYFELRRKLPEDFPDEAVKRLARRLLRCERTELDDIILLDVPEIMTKAEDYAVKVSRVSLGEYDIRNLVHEIYRRKLVATMDSEEQDFHALILSCSVMLADRFRIRSGLPDDAGSIGKALSPNSPLLMVPPDLDSETNKNWQQGAMLLFQGFRAYFRNTHSHQVVSTDADMAFQGLMLISLLTNILDSAHLVDPK